MPANAVAAGKQTLPPRKFIIPFNEAIVTGRSNQIEPSAIRTHVRRTFEPSLDKTSKAAMILQTSTPAAPSPTGYRQLG
jgi:hypothetical protein